MDINKQIEFLLDNQARHDAKIGQLIDNQARHDAQIGKLIDLQKEMMDGINSLVRVAEMHERRIEHLEDSQA